MNRYFIFTLLLLLPLGLQAQSSRLEVVSFKKNGLSTAALEKAVKDPHSGKLCGMLRIKCITPGDLVFSFGMNGSYVPEKVEIQEGTGEINVFVPVDVRQINFKSKSGRFNAVPYVYNDAIEAASVYEVEVRIVGGEEGITIDAQWLLIKPTPADASVFVNGQFVGQGEYSGKLKPGKHTYRIEAPLYYSEEGSVTIVKEKVTMSPKLAPAFGYLTIRSTPESGAKIVLDGKPLSGVTPFTTEALSDGTHTVQVSREMYQPMTQTVTVKSGETTVTDFPLKSNFSEVKLSSNEGASLYLNGERVGVSSWSGRLIPGIYSVEARMASHKTAKKDFETQTGVPQDIQLAPVPILGSVDVVSTPSEATVWIGDRQMGTTPTTISKLLIGSYALRVTQSGCADYTTQIEVTEGATAQVKATLATGRAVVIHSTPQGADLSINGTAVGKTPYEATLGFGTHRISATQGDLSAEQTLDVSTGSAPLSCSLALSAPGKSFTVNDVSFDVILVKGGTFDMGFNNGVRSERPVHSVMLSDYYIGKYEVTQALWQAVMGSNPISRVSLSSRYKGADLPVVWVSWNDCQRFIEKLNDLTGMQFRLPTEAEWEFAARGGLKSKGYTYSGSNTLSEVGWNWNNSGDRTTKGDYKKYDQVLKNNCKTHPVGQKQANELGLYDMSGNVWEWCSDWYDTYPTGAQANPMGASSGLHRVSRGGDCGNKADNCRVYNRTGNSPDRGSGYSFSLGLRLVLVP